MKYKYELIYGIEYNKDKKSVGYVNIDNFLKDIAASFGGYSKTINEGGYIMSDGTLVQELSSTITILTAVNSDILIEGFANILKQLYSQESVIIVRTTIKGRFI